MKLASVIVNYYDYIKSSPGPTESDSHWPKYGQFEHQKG